MQPNVSNYSTYVEEDHGSFWNLCSKGGCWWRRNKLSARVEDGGDEMKSPDGMVRPCRSTRRESDSEGLTILPKLKLRVIKLV